MTTQTSRLEGSTSSLAIKAPCKATSDSNLVLSGEQTINSVSCVTGDRALLRNQTDASENGIWIVDTSAWTRADDFNGARDVAKGTSMRVTDGSLAGKYKIATDNPITVGSTGLSFDTILETDVSSLDQLAGTSDDVTQGSSNLYMSLDERSKLAGIAPLAGTNEDIISGIPYSGVNATVIGDSNSYRAFGYALTDSFQNRVPDSPMTWLRYLLKGRLTINYEDFYGVNGRTFASSISDGALDLAAANDAPVAIIALGVNDINGARTYSAIIADIDTHITSLRAKKKLVLLLAIHPTTTGASGPSSAERVIGYRVNKYMRAVAQSTVGVLYVDAMQYLIDPTSTSGEPLSGLMQDDVHHSIRGSYLAGKAMADVLDPYIPELDFFSDGLNLEDEYNASTNPEGNLITNSTFTGSGGSFEAGKNFTGTAPDDWSFITIGTTGTAACAVSVVERTGFTGRWLKMVFSGTPAGTGTYIFQMFQQPSIGADLDFYSKLRVSYESGFDGLQYTFLQHFDQTGSKTAGDGSASGSDLMPDIDAEGIPLLTETLTKDSGSTVSQWRFRAGFVAGSPISGTVYLQAPSTFIK